MAPTSVTHVFGDPATIVVRNVKKDFFGRLYNDFEFCGLRSHDFVYDGTTTPVPWITYTQSISREINVSYDPDFSQIGQTTVISYTTAMINISGVTSTGLITVQTLCPAAPLFTKGTASFTSVTHTMGEGPKTVGV